MRFEGAELYVLLGVLAATIYSIFFSRKKGYDKSLHSLCAFPLASWSHSSTLSALPHQHFARLGRLGERHQAGLSVVISAESAFIAVWQ